VSVARGNSGSKGPPPPNVTSGRVVAASAITGYGVLGVGLVVVAAHLHGPTRHLLQAVGVLGVGIAVLCFGSLIVIALAWEAVTGTFREHPSTVQRVTWLVAALAAGAVLGTATYIGGPPGLVAGPVVFIGALIAVRALPFDRAYVNHRIITVAAVVGVVSLAVGSTIFL
jgi:hypothetical protein